VISQALDRARTAPGTIGTVYLSGTGDPAQDDCELDLVRAGLGAGTSGSPRVTSLTPLAGDHAGLGALRVAGAAVLSVGDGRVPRLPDLRAPIRDDVDFVTGVTGDATARGPVLVHGLARGGGQAALVLG
jgi:3-oxoacyl-(acyl-carrier-protein) synthase